MLRIYQILSTLLIPVIIFNIFIRIYRKKEDRLRFIERFGKPTVKKNNEKKIKVDKKIKQKKSEINEQNLRLTKNITDQKPEIKKIKKL